MGLICAPNLRWLGPRGIEKVVLLVSLKISSIAAKQQGQRLCAAARKLVDLSFNAAPGHSAPAEPLAPSRGAKRRGEPGGSDPSIGSFRAHRRIIRLKVDAEGAEVILHSIGIEEPPVEESIWAQHHRPFARRDRRPRR